MEFRWEVLAANPLPLWEGFLVTLQALERIGVTLVQ